MRWLTQLLQRATPPRRPAVGEKFWHNGERYDLTAVNGPEFTATRTFGARPPRVTGNVADLQWIDTHQHWALPGREGYMPLVCG